MPAEAFVEIKATALTPMTAAKVIALSGFIAPPHMGVVRDGVNHEIDRDHVAMIKWAY
jgi:hypothetical protein